MTALNPISLSSLPIRLAQTTQCQLQTLWNISRMQSLNLKLNENVLYAYLMYKHSGKKIIEDEKYAHAR